MDSVRLLSAVLIHWLLVARRVERILHVVHQQVLSVILRHNVNQIDEQPNDIQANILARRVHEQNE